MFASSVSASEFRKRLKRHGDGSNTNERARQYMRSTIGPFGGIDSRATAPDNSGGVSVDKQHLRALDLVSKHVLMAAPITMVVETARGDIRVMRGEEHVALTREFQSFVSDTFQRIMFDAMRQLVVYGVCVVLVVDRPKSRSGLQPLQRTDVAAYGRKAKRATVDLEPVVLDLADDNVSLSFTDEGGLRSYHIEVDGVDASITSDPDRVVLSVANAPTRDGLCSSLPAGLMSEIVQYESHAALVLDVALEQARPTTLLQERHGPSASRGGGADGLTAGNLFFDTESAEIAKRQNKERFEGVVDLLKAINQRQTTNQEPVKAGNLQKEFAEPRLHVISQGLETATHAVTPSRASLVELTAMRRALDEEVSTAFGLPPGLLRHGDGKSTSSSNIQHEMFKQRCAVLTRACESVLSAVWHRLDFAGSVDDAIAIIPADVECRNFERIESLHSAGLLPTDVAQKLVANALNLQECVAISAASSKLGQGHHLGSSPRPSAAPSEAGSLAPDNMS